MEPLHRDLKKFFLQNPTMRFNKESFDVPHVYQGIETFEVLFATFCLNSAMHIYTDGILLLLFTVVRRVPS